MIQQALIEIIRTGMLDAKERAARLTEGLSARQLVWRPGEGVWGIADCLEHVMIVDTLYLRGIVAALERAKPEDAGAKKFRSGIFGKMFVHMVSARSTSRIKTFALFEPPDEPDPKAAHRFSKHEGVMMDVIETAAAYDLNRVKLTSPASRFVRFRLGECLQMLAAHQERHIEQAEAVVGHEAFPSS